MKPLVGTDADEETSPCVMYDGLTDDHEDIVEAADTTMGYAEMGVCRVVINKGTAAGSGLVGSDDKVAVTFEVTVPTFSAGKNNYICMNDGEDRQSDTDVEDFHLEPSIRVVPTTVKLRRHGERFRPRLPLLARDAHRAEAGGHRRIRHRSESEESRPGERRSRDQL